MISIHVGKTNAVTQMVNVSERAWAEVMRQLPPPKTVGVYTVQVDEETRTYLTVANEGKRIYRVRGDLLKNGRPQVDI